MTNTEIVLRETSFSALDLGVTKFDRKPRGRGFQVIFKHNQETVKAAILKTLASLTSVKDNSTAAALIADAAKLGFEAEARKVDSERVLTDVKRNHGGRQVAAAEVKQTKPKAYSTEGLETFQVDGQPLQVVAKPSRTGRRSRCHNTLRDEARETVCQAVWTGLNTSHCDVCHNTFGGVVGFDAHRVGEYDSKGNPRRCVDPSTVGYKLSSKGTGVWVGTYGDES